MDAKQEVTVCGKPSRPFVPEDLSMPLRLRKLIGTLIIIFLVITYALLATTFAEVYLGASAWYTHLTYFLEIASFWVSFLFSKHPVSSLRFERDID